jgi:hypothetical protein
MSFNYFSFRSLLLLFCVFTLQLNSQSISVSRGPYLNQATPNSVIIKWRTSQSTTSQVWFGTNLNSLTSFSFNIANNTNHEIKISGLQPATKYYYMVGNTTGTFTPLNPLQYFKTSPITGTKGKYNFWVIGDAGTASINQINAKNAFVNYTDSSHIDGWLWLGDNAYDGGFDSEYQDNVFAQNIYANELKRVVTWPALGNHDYNNSIPFSPSPAYFDIFSLPTNGEAGGIASGTEKYYSYNYGNIHFIVLDSYGTGRGSSDPMANWLQSDLNNNTLPWVIAYWHHPPYTKGSHNSDNSNFLDGELVDMRQNILPILENGGVDLVLNGHSHCYERSFLIDSHYGSSNQLNTSMIKDNGSGSYPTTCPYQKQTIINKAHKGTVYAVVGCSGKTSGTSSGWPHPVMYSYTNSMYGSMLLQIENNRLDAKFITSVNQVYDSFTIIKNAGKKQSIQICQGSSVTLTPSRPGSMNWLPQNITADSVSVSPPFTTVYYAVDLANCIKDTFQINVVPNNVPPCNITGINKFTQNDFAYVYPSVFNGVKEEIEINVFSEKKLNDVTLYDLIGKHYAIKMQAIESNVYKISYSGKLAPGVYFIKLNAGTHEHIQKLIIQ